MSISRKQAISQKTSFLPAMKGAKHEVQPGLTVYTTLHESTAVGVLIPKKCVKLSVDRHRLKRRIAALVATEPLAGVMLVVRVTKTMDPALDLTKLKLWFAAQLSLQNSSSVGQTL